MKIALKRRNVRGYTLKVIYACNELINAVFCVFFKFVLITELTFL